MPRKKKVPHVVNTMLAERTAALQEFEAGSRPLQNIRWEKYAQGLATGTTQNKAYKAAGFAPSNRSAVVLANRTEIKDRVAWIIQQAVAETKLTIQRVLDELEKIGFANMLDYIKIGEDGQPVLNFTELDRNKAAAIGEIVTDEITSPRDGSVTRRTKFKLLDKKGALIDLGKYLGMFVDRKEVKVGGVMFHMDANDMNL